MRVVSFAILLCGLVIAGPSAAELKLVFSGKVKQTFQDVGKKARTEQCVYQFQIDQLGDDYFLTWKNPGCKTQRITEGADGSASAIIFNKGAPQSYTCKWSGGIRRCSDGRVYRSSNKRTINNVERNAAKRTARALTLKGKTTSERIYSNSDVRDWTMNLALAVTLRGDTCELKSFKAKAVTKKRSSGTAKRVTYQKGKGSSWSWAQDLIAKGKCRVLSQ